MHLEAFLQSRAGLGHSQSANYVKLSKHHMMRECLNTLFDNDLNCYEHACKIYNDTRDQAISEGYNVVIDSLPFDVAKLVSIVHDVRGATAIDQTNRRLILLIVISPSQVTEDHTGNKIVDDMIASCIGKQSYNFHEIYLHDGATYNHQTTLKLGDTAEVGDRAGFQNLLSSPRPVYAKDGQRARCSNLLTNSEGILRYADSGEEPWWSPRLPDTAALLKQMLDAATPVRPSSRLIEIAV